MSYYFCRLGEENQLLRDENAKKEELIVASSWFLPPQNEIASKVFPQQMKLHINPEIERTIEQSRKAIPSIPSHANSYGYSEIDSIFFLAQVFKKTVGNNIVANKNPLDELQKVFI